MTDIKPCTVKGCKFAGYHHHATANNTCHREGAASRCLLNCGRQGGVRGWTATVSPRLTRKALNARIAALEAENADLHAVSADQAARLHALEKIGAEWDSPEVYAIEDAHGCISTRGPSWPEDSVSYERDCGPCRIVAIYKDGRD